MHKNLKGEIIVSYHKVSAGVNGAVKQEAFHSDTKFILWHKNPTCDMDLKPPIRS